MDFVTYINNKVKESQHDSFTLLNNQTHVELVSYQEWCNIKCIKKMVYGYLVSLRVDYLNDSEEIIISKLNSCVAPTHKLIAIVQSMRIESLIIKEPWNTGDYYNKDKQRIVTY